MKPIRYTDDTVSREYEEQGDTFARKDKASKKDVAISPCYVIGLEQNITKAIMILIAMMGNYNASVDTTLAEVIEILDGGQT